MTDFTECDKLYASVSPEPEHLVPYTRWSSEKEGFRACWQLRQQEIDELKANLADVTAEASKYEALLSTLFMIAAGFGGTMAVMWIWGAL